VEIGEPDVEDRPLGAAPLALAQTGMMAERLERAGATVEIVTVTTPGDRSHAPVSEIGIGGVHLGPA